MLSRIWTFSHRKEFTEKHIKKAEGAFKDFPRFAYAHCSSPYFFSCGFPIVVFLADPNFVEMNVWMIGILRPF